MSELMNPDEATTRGQDMLTFRIGGEWFAAPLASVDEALDLVPESIQGVPVDVGALDGVFVLRDALVPLYAPQRALGIAPGGRNTALIVRSAGTVGRAAIAVDDVDDVLTVREEDIRATADGSGGGIVRGVLRRDAGVVAVVDLHALVAACRTGNRGETT